MTGNYDWPQTIPYQYKHDDFPSSSLPPTHILRSAKFFLSAWSSMWSSSCHQKILSSLSGVKNIYAPSNRQSISEWVTLIPTIHTQINHLVSSKRPIPHLLTKQDSKRQYRCALDQQRPIRSSALCSASISVFYHLTPNRRGGSSVDSELDSRYSIDRNWWAWGRVASKM